MLRLRLRRVGRRNLPCFQIVAIDARNKREGIFKERLGYYQPLNKINKWHINVERARYWIGVGASSSDRVLKILSKVEDEFIQEYIKTNHDKFLSG